MADRANRKDSGSLQAGGHRFDPGHVPKLLFSFLQLTLQFSPNFCEKFWEHWEQSNWKDLLRNSCPVAHRRLPLWGRHEVTESEEAERILS